MAKLFPYPSDPNAPTGTTAPYIPPDGFTMPSGEVVYGCRPSQYPWALLCEVQSYSQPNDPLSYPDPLNVDMSSPLPVSGVSGALPNAGRDCGCCSGSAVGGLTPSPAGATVTATATAPGKCQCGYTDRQALLAMVVAAAVLFIINKRR